MVNFAQIVLLIACHFWLATADPPNTVEVTKEVFLDIEMGGRPVGRIILGLFGNIAPKTVTNFVALADQEVRKR